MPPDPETTTFCYDVQRQKRTTSPQTPQQALALVLSQFAHAKYVERVSGEKKKGKKRKADADTST